MTSSDLKLHWKPCVGHRDGIGFRKFECFGRDEIVTRPPCQRYASRRPFSFRGGWWEVPRARIDWDYVKFVRESGE